MFEHIINAVVWSKMMYRTQIHAVVHTGTHTYTNGSASISSALWESRYSALQHTTACSEAFLIIIGALTSSYLVYFLMFPFLL